MEMPVTRADTLLSMSKIAGLFAAILALTAWVFSAVVGTKITALKLDLNQRYVVKEDAVSRREYDIRHADMIRDQARSEGRLDELEHRVMVIHDDVTKLADRKR